MQNGTGTLVNNSAVPWKVKYEETTWPTNFTLRHKPKKLKT